MTASAHDSPATLDLSLEETWVVHTALLRHLEREAEQDRHAHDALALLRALERDQRTTLDAADQDLLGSVLVEYLGDAPIRDRATCRVLLESLRDVST